MRLSSRLKYLEQRLAPPAPRKCGVCGLLLPGAPSKGPAHIRVGWWEPGSAPEPPCPACGQRKVIRIEFDKAG